MQNENHDVPLHALKSKPEGEGWIYDTYYEFWWRPPSPEQQQAEQQMFVVSVIVCIVLAIAIVWHT